MRLWTKRPMVSKCIFKMVPEQVSECARPGPMDLPFSMRVVELIVLPCLAFSIIWMATGTLQAPVPMIKRSVCGEVCVWRGLCVERSVCGEVDVDLPLACLSNCKEIEYALAVTL